MYSFIKFVEQLVICDKTLQGYLKVQIKRFNKYKKEERFEKSTNLLHWES